MDKPTCASCVYWNPTTGDYGQCRRRAPVRDIQVLCADKLESMPEMAITWEKYWCGDHQDMVKWMLSLPLPGTASCDPISTASGSSAASGTTA